MARSNQLVTLEVTNSTKEIGELYPARRVHSVIDTGGIVQWIVDYNVLCFEINNVIPEMDRLYKARKARTRTGLVNSKPVYMLEYCCGLIDDNDRYWATCDDFVNAEHSATLESVATFFPDCDLISLYPYTPPAAFALYPTGLSAVEGFAEFTYTNLGTTVYDRYRVTGFCSFGDIGNGEEEFIRWELQHVERTINEVPELTSSTVFFSNVPLNDPINIRGSATSFCLNPAYWTSTPPGVTTNFVLIVD